MELRNGEKMLDKIKFMEMLGDLKEIAQTQGNTLTQDEIKVYFDEMELSEEHYNHIYTYLTENQISINGFNAKEEVNEDNMREEDSVFLSMFLKELRTFEKLNKEEEFVLLREVKNEIPGAKERLINVWLPKVVRIAKKYKNQGVFLEDLIQEGNIGLLIAVENLSNLEDSIDMETYLKEMIMKSMEESIDENMDEDVLENTLLGRSNLIQEAANYLAEDLGQVPTVEQLAEYTKLTVEEIKEIGTIAKDVVEISKDV